MGVNYIQKGGSDWYQWGIRNKGFLDRNAIC
jgi:hypothetical protein